jgi:tetratricopeptide (TPR) repeat protein
VLALYPDGNRALHALTRGLVDAKRYADAERWADLFLERQPRDPNSYLLKGVILENTERCPQALEYFRLAFPISARDFHPALHQHLGSCLYLTKDFTAAYEHFQKGVNIYLRNEPNETLYQYAFAAVIAGDIWKAKILLDALLYQTPENESHLIERARGLMKQIVSDPSLDAGLIGGMPR